MPAVLYSRGRELRAALKVPDPYSKLTGTAATAGAAREATSVILNTQVSSKDLDGRLLVLFVPLAPGPTFASLALL